MVDAWHEAMRSRRNPGDTRASPRADLGPRADEAVWERAGARAQLARRLDVPQCLPATPLYDMILEMLRMLKNARRQSPAGDEHVKREISRITEFPSSGLRARGVLLRSRMTTFSLFAAASSPLSPSSPAAARR